MDEVAWTDRLLLIMRFLDEGAIGGLLNFSGIKTRYVRSFHFRLTFVHESPFGFLNFGWVNSRPTVYERFIEACEANNVSARPVLSISSLRC